MEHDVKKLSKIYSIKLRRIYNIINSAEKENRLELTHSGGRQSKIIKCDQSKIIENINNNPKTSWRQFIALLENECGQCATRPINIKLIIY